jgi:hypothetical protein
LCNKLKFSQTFWESGVYFDNELLITGRNVLFSYSGYQMKENNMVRSCGMYGETGEADKGFWLGNLKVREPWKT